jgi:hypothetical protein
VHGVNVHGVSVHVGKKVFALRPQATPDSQAGQPLSAGLP